MASWMWILIGGAGDASSGTSFIVSYVNFAVCDMSNLRRTRSYLGEAQLSPMLNKIHPVKSMRFQLALCVFPSMFLTA